MTGWLNSDQEERTVLLDLFGNGDLTALRW